MSVLDGMRLAVGTLTILPTGRIAVTRRSAAVAMSLAPLAAVPLGLAVAVIGASATVLAAPPLVTALLVLAVLALGTRALHLDGLADTVDGLGAGWDRERALAVMRRGDVGPMGVVALVLTLGLQAVAASTILEQPTGWLVVAGLVCVSRGALALACARPLRPARDDGLGAAVVGTVPLPVAILVWTVLLVAGALLAMPAGILPTHGLVATAVAGLVVLAVLGWCTRRLGGLTGDVLGATIELALAVLLVGFAV